MSILNHQQYLITATTWTPLWIQGAISRMWIDFSGDMKLRSDPNDATTEFLCSVANGTQYLIPLTQILNVNTAAMLTNAQSVNGEQTITLSWIKDP
jgi:hypothetical protein